jgi:hypothetical protein
VYTTVLAVLPLASTRLGLTGPMFMIDGGLVNGFLLVRAFQFYRNPNDDSARQLFRTSLWHLPLFLALLVFHKLRTTSETALDLDEVHDLGRKLCIHELMVDHDAQTNSSFCPAKADVATPLRETSCAIASATESMRTRGKNLIEDEKS